VSLLSFSLKEYSVATPQLCDVAYGDERGPPKALIASSFFAAKSDGSILAAKNSWRAGGDGYRRLSLEISVKKLPLSASLLLAHQQINLTIQCHNLHDQYDAVYW